MECSWKPNLPETKQNFNKWWKREGLLIGMWGAPFGMPGVPLTKGFHEDVPSPTVYSQSDERYFSDIEARIQRSHYILSRQSFLADILPVPETIIGPGSLALYMGCVPGFTDRSVWYHPLFEDLTNPTEAPALKFDPQNKWWQIQEETLRRSVALAKGKYPVGFPDLVENIDTLASLRGTVKLLLDMVMYPEWVEEKVEEINQAFFQVFDRIYDIIKLEDGSSVFEAFRLWGPGKTAKVQCDTSVMFSNEMFERFVIPALTRQCEWLDNSLYHLDGKEQFRHLDSILGIEALDAIQWTPNAGDPSGGNEKWYDLYKNILNNGKSVQILRATVDEVVPLLDAIGGKGVYVLVQFNSESEVESTLKAVEQFR